MTNDEQQRALDLIAGMLSCPVIEFRAVVKSTNGGEMNFASGRFAKSKGGVMEVTPETIATGHTCKWAAHLHESAD